MKIKRKVEMNLPQLIKYAWENNVRDKVFWTTKDNRGVSYEACFSEFGSFYSDDILDSNVIFTVEVEEEITEDTVLSKLTCYTAFGFKGTKYNISINDVKSHNPLAFYIMNDDLTMTLIWTHEKGLVE